MDRNSLLIWYPKIKDLDIPTPRTEIVAVKKEELKIMYNEMMPQKFVARVARVIHEKFKLPVFLRTDIISGKHGWTKTCYFDGSHALWKHLLAILVDNLLADKLDISAFAVREYIPMASRFVAFYGSMPVNPERRYFIKDGHIQCSHVYWTEDSIQPTLKDGLPADWKELLRKMNHDRPQDFSTLTYNAMKVAGEFKLDGCWSVDFCKARDGRWILIDMAVAEDSWHPKECAFATKSG